MYYVYKIYLYTFVFLSIFKNLQNGLVDSAFNCVTSNGKKLNKQLNEAFYWRKKIENTRHFGCVQHNFRLKKKVTGRKEKFIMISGKTKTLSWSVHI